MTAIIHIDNMRPFSETHQLYRAFNHMIAARHGQLLVVPLHLVHGRFTDMVDGCPVPWEEVVGLIDAPVGSFEVEPEESQFRQAIQPFYKLIKDSKLPGGFYIDAFGISPDQRNQFIRVTHKCGALFAFTPQQ